MEERRVKYFLAPWCDACAEYMAQVERAADFMDMPFDLIQEGESTYNHAMNRYAIHKLPVVVVTNGDTYKKYIGVGGISDFLILYSDE